MVSSDRCLLLERVQRRVVYLVTTDRCLLVEQVQRSVVRGDY